MNTLTVLHPSTSDAVLVKLAREIAMDIQPFETILKLYSIDAETWARLRENPRFQAVLASEVETWQSALNIHERVKAKAAAMFEEWLPELNNRLHDQEEALPAKVEAGKLLAKIADMEPARGLPGVGGGGERFTVTINLGADVAPIKIEKENPKVIEHEG